MDVFATVDLPVGIYVFFGGGCVFHGRTVAIFHILGVTFPAFFLRMMCSQSRGLEDGGKLKGEVARTYKNGVVVSNAICSAKSGS